ncbi:MULTISPECIES: hypothetical protein [unclassified Bradyrhizobium]|uniref:hypothetical protein n=1 Tax=unclassified Bradyrhizobium TaxID=2631580 RepID=UPI0023B0F935|nr:hypothetical protein [Bradyrhizobium sp. CSS354]MDE5464945.1 DUF2974 domain-containing protein [Bradyrhizobium sp. CSS354]
MSNEILKAELAANDRIAFDNPTLHYTAAVPPLPAGYSILTNVPSRVSESHGFFAEAFTDDNGNIIVAFEGSVLDPSDPNFLTKWGMNSRGDDNDVLNHKIHVNNSAFSDALKFTNDVIAANPFSTVYLTGHSLGGAEAQYVASNLSDDAHIGGGATFGSPGIFADGLRPPTPSFDFINYLDYGDPIANFGIHFGSTFAVGDVANQANTMQIESEINFALTHHFHFPGIISALASISLIHNFSVGALGIVRPSDVIKHAGELFDTIKHFHELGQYDKDINSITTPPPPPGDILLFSETFDNFGQTASLPFVADLAQHGWTNVNNGGETTVQLLPKNASMDFYLNTRDTDGFELLIGNTFRDPTGGKAILSFDFSTLPGMNVPDSLLVMTDNIFSSNIVASFKGTDLTSGWHHADIVIDTGGTPNVTHSFFINDQGNPHSISSIGFAIDNIKIHDFLIV